MFRREYDNGKAWIEVNNLEYADLYSVTISNGIRTFRFNLFSSSAIVLQELFDIAWKDGVDLGSVEHAWTKMNTLQGENVGN